MDVVHSTFEELNGDFTFRYTCIAIDKFLCRIQSDFPNSFLDGLSTIHHWVSYWLKPTFSCLSNFLAFNSWLCSIFLNKTFIIIVSSFYLQMKLLASQFRLFSLNLNLPIAKGVVRMALIAQFNFVDHYGLTRFFLNFDMWRPVCALLLLMSACWYMTNTVHIF